MNIVDKGSTTIEAYAECAAPARSDVRYAEIHV